MRIQAWQERLAGSQRTCHDGRVALQPARVAQPAAQRIQQRGEQHLEQVRLLGQRQRRLLRGSEWGGEDGVRRGEAAL